MAALGPDVTLYKDCFGETTSLNNFFITTGFSANWNTANTVAAPAGTYRLVAGNSTGCTDTVFAYIILEVANWTGTVSSDWNNPANWNIGKVPDTLTHLIVPGGTPNSCIVSTANAVAASIQVRNGGNVPTINNRAVLVNGKMPDTASKLRFGFLKFKQLQPRFIFLSRGFFTNVPIFDLKEE